MSLSSFTHSINKKFHWRVSVLVAWYTFRDIFRSFGTYVLLSLGWLVVYYSIGNTLEVIRKGFATVIREPLSLIVLGMLIVLSLFFSIIVGISLVRDREQGVVELLFYGPISHLEYISGKFMAHWISYAILAIIFVLGSWIMAGVTGLPVSFYLMELYCFSLFLSAAMIVIGQLIATLTRSIRGTIFIFTVVIVLLLIIQLGDSFSPSAAQIQENPALIELRDSLAIVSSVINWLSPLAMFLKGVEALVRNNALEIIGQGVRLVIFTLVIFGSSVVFHSRRGILP